MADRATLSGETDVAARRISWPTAREWLSFLVQILAVGMIQIVNDLIRGNFWPPNASVAMEHAGDVVSAERALGLFVEPGIQIFFQHTHSLLGLSMTWRDIMQFANTAYVMGHLGVTFCVAAWVFVWHRRYFAPLRNVTLLVNLLALVGYEIYPLAPPRLTPGLTWNGHPFHFQDTMVHIIGNGKLNGVPIGYNAYSAMPSLHVAWAIVIGATVILLAKNPITRVLGLLYPCLIIWATVVTGNHYVLDAVGAAFIVAVAVVLAAVWDRFRGRRPEPARHATAAPG